MMTQNKKIVRFRLGKRLNWCSLLKSNKEKCKKINFKALHTMNCLKELCLLSECFLSYTRKGLRLNSKVVQESDVILFDKLSSSNVSTYESVRQAQKRKLQTPCVRPSYKNLSLEVVQVCERS